MKRALVLVIAGVAMVIAPATGALAASAPPANCNGQFNSLMSSTLQGDVAGLTAAQAHDVWTIFGVGYGKAVVYVGNLNPQTCTE